MKKPRPRKISYTYVENVSMTHRQFDDFMNAFLDDESYYLKYTMCKDSTTTQWFSSNTYDVADTMSDIAHTCWKDKAEQYLKKHMFPTNAIKIEHRYVTLTD